MYSETRKLKNVRLEHTLERGEDTWILIHSDGSIDTYFTYVANWMIAIAQYAYNTRQTYCIAIAYFIDYLIEIGKWARENGIKYLDGSLLVEAVRSYPKALAGGKNTSYKMVAEVAERLKLEPMLGTSQKGKIAAINHYLQLSEDFNSRMTELNIGEINGMTLYSEERLFPHIREYREIPQHERIGMTETSMIAGVICGGPLLRKLAILKFNARQDCGEDDKYSYEDAFPLEHAIDLINDGFKNNRDKALNSLLFGVGCRISEAQLVTFDDLDVANRRVYLNNPHKKTVKDFKGYLTYEEIKKLPWNGRANKLTLFIEPFASMFWHFFELYLNEEIILTNQHNFIWQKRDGHPLWKTDGSNLRKNFAKACRRIGIEPRNIHSARHLYGVYCLNYFPRENGTFGLPVTTVQNLMGHALLSSTTRYAKPDIELLEIEQRATANILNGFAIEPRKQVMVNILADRLRRYEDDIRAEKVLLAVK